MKIRNSSTWMKTFAGTMAAVGASALISLPVLAQFQYASSIFSPPASATRSVDGTVAGELDSAIKYYRDFQAFAEAMKTAGLTETLRGKNQGNPNQVMFTVFAPTDEAFAALPAEIRQNPEKLRQVLNYHIVAGQVTEQDLAKGELRTVAGNSVQIKLNESGDQLTLNGASVIQSSQRVDNGVIVVINKVLVPPGLF